MRIAQRSKACQAHNCGSCASCGQTIPLMTTHDCLTVPRLPAGRRCVAAQVPFQDSPKGTHIKACRPLRTGSSDKAACTTVVAVRSYPVVISCVGAATGAEAAAVCGGSGRNCNSLCSALVHGIVLFAVVGL